MLRALAPLLLLTSPLLSSCAFQDSSGDGIEDFLGPRRGGHVAINPDHGTTADAPSLWETRRGGVFGPNFSPWLDTALDIC